MSNDPEQPADPTPSNAAPDGPPSHVEAVDGQGRRVQIPRDEYRSRVLPQMLAAHDKDPDRLAAVILQAVHAGFAADVLAAANRLTVIDKGNLERALSVLSVVQRDAGEFDMAEATLKELEQRKPDSASAKVGMGLLREKQGDLAAAADFLWRAIEQDCNHPDAVHAFLRLRHGVVGDDGFRAEIEKVMALPGAWRARLWLARWHLDKGDEADAVEIYRDVLGQDDAAGDALLMAAGDLVQRQRHALVDELIAERFRPGEHHPHVGIALLQHYRLQQRHVEGESLLHRMYVAYGHALGADLQPFSAEFDRMRLAELPPPPPPPQNPRITILRLDRPSWYAGFDDPQWLLPPKAQGHKHVIVFGLSIDGQPQLEPAQQDELGRATRGLALWFAEQLWLASPHRGTAALPTAEHGGWALLGRPWPEDQLAAQVPENERADTVLVTGQLRVDGERRRIDLWAYDCGQQQRIGHAAAEGRHEQHGELLLQLMRELWPVLGGPKDHRPQLGDAAFWHRYADGMSQQAALVLTQTGALPKERLYGARHITQWLQAAALQETRWQPGFWLLGSALCVLQQLGSNVAEEHARLFAEVFRQSPANSAIARLGARILPACGLSPLWQGRQGEIEQAAQGEPNVLAWLQRVAPKG